MTHTETSEQLIPDHRSRLRPAQVVEQKVRARLGMLPVSQLRMDTVVRRGDVSREIKV